jgi:hypothetical protein
MFSFENSEKMNCAYPTIKETIPKSSLGYNTNNKYPEFPPLMADGRAITASYQPEALLNQSIIKQNNIQSNWEYRKYLTENATKIMEMNARESFNDSGYTMRFDDLMNNRFSSPYYYTSPTDTSRPFGYVNSDLKNTYLSREQLESRKFSPVITQEEFLRFAGNQ